MDRFKEYGIDPDEPQAGRKGQELLTINVIDYFRVEPLSSVLTFLIAAASLLTALTESSLPSPPRDDFASVTQFQTVVYRYTCRLEPS